MRYVETVVRVAAAPEAVLAAFSDVAAMQEWWGVDRGLVEACEGGVWALAWEPSPQGFRYVMTGRIESIDPGHRLRVTNLVYLTPERPVLGPMALTIDVDREDGVTVVTIRQAGYREGPVWDWYHEAVSKAWPVAAESLRRFVDRGATRPR